MMVTGQVTATLGCFRFSILSGNRRFSYSWDMSALH
jgi:hypothetical protein